MEVVKYDLGNCFENAFYMQYQFMRDALLVHGCPVQTVEPHQRTAHAWIEFNGYVFDTEALDDNGQRHTLCINISEYYQIAQPDGNTFRYTFDDSTRMLCTFRHSGPWEGPFAIPPYTEDEFRANAGPFEMWKLDCESTQLLQMIRNVEHERG